jgi:5,6,7,8-tetrahydromethanopterin hydro-lyase
MADQHQPAVMDIGEAFVGEGAEAAHLNTMLGPRHGPVGTAWATALSTPSAGHAPFMCILRPGVPVQPPTLFVNKAAISGDRHGRLTWGAAQAGVALGVQQFVEGDAGVTDDEGRGLVLSDGRTHRLDALVLVCAVWVDPTATDEELLFTNNAGATRLALETGGGLRPWPDSTGVEPANPFFRT